MQLQSFIPAGVVIVLALLLSLLLLGFAIFFGPKRASAVKLSTFECGMEPIGSPRARTSIRFYQIAILFLVFDVEAAFMYPWVVNFQKLGRTPTGEPSLFGFVEMLVFVAVLVIALAYVWRKKAIAWE
ncbi:MAG: NADH-quinone oxidoreductase subunit A [Pseudomonadota bacterium]